MVHHIFMTIFAVVPLALGGRSDGGTGYDLLKVTSEARKDIAWKKATFLAAAKGDADTIAALAAAEAEDRARPDRFPATTRARQSRQAKLAADRDDQNKMSPAHEDISKLGEDIPKPGAVGAIREWVDWLFSSAPDELLFSGNADPATAAALGVTTGKVSASGSSPPDLSKPGPAAALWGWADRLIPSVPGVWLVSGARDHTPAEPLDAGTRKVSAHRPSTPETTQGEAAALVEEKATTPPSSSGDRLAAQLVKTTPESNGFDDPKWQAITPHFSIGDRVEAQGLKARPELNGQLGKVQSSLENGRYAVEFEMGDTGRLQAGNLKAADTAEAVLPPAAAASVPQGFLNAAFTTALNNSGTETTASQATFNVGDLVIFTSEKTALDALYYGCTGTVIDPEGEGSGHLQKLKVRCAANGRVRWTDPKELEAAEHFSNGDLVRVKTGSHLSLATGQVEGWSQKNNCNRVFFEVAAQRRCVEPEKLEAAEQETQQMKAKQKSPTNRGQNPPSRSGIGKDRGSARQMRVRAGIGNDEKFADTGLVKTRCNGKYGEAMTISGCEVTHMVSSGGEYMYEETCKVRFTEEGRDAMMNLEELKRWKPLKNDRKSLNNGLYKLKYNFLDADAACDPVLEEAA